MIKSLIIDCDIDDKIPLTVQGDPNRIRQILLNFLSNAAKFTDNGTITLSAKPTKNNRIKIAVSDSGCGIPDEEKDVLFSPYSQHASNKIKSQGTGLGLYICKKLIAAMDGSIGLDSKAGEGSTFWIELPLPESKDTPVPLAGQLNESVLPNRNKNENLNILVAEDNAANQLVIEKLLQKMGHKVEVVVNGQEAVNAIINGNKLYDLILMDCEMPIMDGYIACEKIRQFEQSTDSTPIPIIALTAHAMKQYREKCIQSGMNEVLTKPVRALSLQQTLRRYSKLIRPEIKQ